MITKKITRLFLAVLLTACLGMPGVKADEPSEWLTVMPKTLQAYREPNDESAADFNLYEGMQIKMSESLSNNEGRWISIKANGRKYWVRQMEGERTNLTSTETSKQIIDMYHVLDNPHRYAIKLVKEPGAKGRIETYEKKDAKYLLGNVYPVTYRKEGSKSHYSDLRTVGGPVIRYVYRTMNTSMEGRDKSGKEFGVYKVSYPMPHDALPPLLEGKIGIGQYNNIPVINEVNGKLLPHPHSYMGADILIHTARWGSRGCINVENEQMGLLYSEDLVTENDKELIPLVIYDEDMLAPPVGELF